MLKSTYNSKISQEHQKHVFEQIMENSESISVQGYNKNHEVIYWNKASETIYGYSEAEAMGKKLENLIIPKDIQDIVKNSIDDWMYNGIAIPSSELLLIDKFGNDVNVFSQHVMIKSKTKNPEMYCLDINLNETKKLQKELIEEKNFLNAIFNVIPDLVWLKDRDGVYLKCNHKFEQFFGEDESKIIHKTDFDFIDTKQAQFFREHDLVSIKANKSTMNEEYLTFADGSYEGTYETIKTPMKDENGIIKLKASNEGNQIVIEISDDGSGIDKDKVLFKSIEKKSYLKKRLIPYQIKEFLI